ncbi:MAG: fluoride efflux transporter CrcB [Methylovirgula sp.]|nr:fluoride efflux transporter CrcB [Methylovirgula sp.]
MWAYVTIAIGGIFGCWARYAMTNTVQGLLGRGFPYATLSVNILACLLIGFLFTATVERMVMTPAIRLGILTGFIGGFSTFSTFAMETYLLAEQGQWGRGALYIFLSVLLGLAATAAGVFAARAI